MVSCSEVVLVDVAMKERPNNAYRVYAILDKQSNTSLISSELADELGVVGPGEKYFRTTCSGEKEVRYWRRVTGAIVKSLNGTSAELTTLIECENIPHDKREILMPEMARTFAHLQHIAD